MNVAWKLPPKIKILEALGSLADSRLQVSGNRAKVFSSSRNKYYDVFFDPDSNSIMSNDNGSYWQGYLGYPAIALLLHLNVLKFNQVYADWLKGIKWKDINTKFDNDFEKTTVWIHKNIEDKGFDPQDLEREVDKIYSQLESLGLQMLGSKAKPPSGY
jgi:hypothetical protein